MIYDSIFKNGPSLDERFRRETSKFLSRFHRMFYEVMFGFISKLLWETETEEWRKREKPKSKWKAKMRKLRWRWRNHWLIFTAEHFFFIYNGNLLLTDIILFAHLSFTWAIIQLSWENFELFELLIFARNECFHEFS